MSHSDAAIPSEAAAIPEKHYFTKVVHHEGYDRISPLRPELSARGKNVIVTGGGTGIGKSIAANFVLAGAKSVSILGRREQRLKTALEEIRGNADTSLLYRIADLTKRHDVSQALQSIVAEVGKIDILVSNAASLPELGPIAGYDAAKFMRAFELNVVSTFHAVQEFLPVAAADPTIINISTCLAHMAPMPGAGGYNISKAANLKMMDQFATENPSVHVVNVQPGTVDTEMSAQVGVKTPDQGMSPSA